MMLAKCSAEDSRITMDWFKNHDQISISTFGDTDSKPAECGFLVFFRHIQTGLPHGVDTAVQRHEMLAGTSHRK